MTQSHASGTRERQLSFDVDRNKTLPLAANDFATRPRNSSIQDLAKLTLDVSCWERSRIGVLTVSDRTLAATAIGKVVN